MIELHRFKMLNSKCRSTPCPNVKHGDEWGEPSKCESGDSCQYCHSRTEQQFHPEVRRSTMACCSRTREMKTVGVFQFARHQNSHAKELFITCFFFKIYKSTKCNDMRQTGYCPRGPFCAFAHVESKWRFISTFQRWEKKRIVNLHVLFLFCFICFVLQEFLLPRRRWARCWRWYRPAHSLSWAHNSTQSVQSASGTVGATPPPTQQAAMDKSAVWVFCVGAAAFQ